MFKELTEHVKRSGPVFGFIGVVGGLIADVFQPLAPFASYLFFAGAVAFITLFIIVISSATLRLKVIPALIFSFGILVFSGIIYSLQSGNAKEDGFLSSAVPGIKKLQASIGILQQDIADIKNSTKHIEETTVAIASTLSEIQKGFADLNQNGGIIANPNKPEQYYHNARIYEQRGDYLNARQSYNSFFTFKLNFIDPHLRYQTFLKIQEGRAGAREIYGIMYENDQRPITEFAKIILFDSPVRTQMLNDYIDRNPNFAPAYYELSREYSEARKGVQSLKDKEQEQAVLNKFLSLHEEGHLLKYFIDNELASSWVDYAERRLKALNAISDKVFKKPVTITAMRSNSGWILNFTIAEKIREIFYREENQKDFISTGMKDTTDPLTGQPRPKKSISLPKYAEKTTFYVKYIDLGGNERGPFVLEFDPAIEMARCSKRALDATKTSWVSFREWQGKLQLYFSHLVTFRCGIKEVRYGIDTDLPDKVFDLPVCDLENPYVKPRDAILAQELPLDTKIVSVELLYADGNTSKVQEFRR